MIDLLQKRGHDLPRVVLDANGKPAKATKDAVVTLCLDISKRLKVEEKKKEVSERASQASQASQARASLLVISVGSSSILAC